MRALIAYYTRSGNTEKVGRTIGDILTSYGVKVDYEKIRPLKQYNYFKSGLMAFLRREVPILNTNLDVREYDIVIIGTPVWVSNPAPPVNSYLSDVEGTHGKKIAVFATMVAAGGKKVIRRISDIIQAKGAMVIEGLYIPAGDILSADMVKAKAEDFVKLIMK